MPLWFFKEQFPVFLQQSLSSNTREVAVVTDTAEAAVLGLCPSSPTVPGSLGAAGGGQGLGPGLAACQPLSSTSRPSPWLCCSPVSCQAEDSQHEGMMVATWAGNQTGLFQLQHSIQGLINETPRHSSNSLSPAAVVQRFPEQRHGRFPVLDFRALCSAHALLCSLGL